jgi:TatD DNase family protein
VGIHPCSTQDFTSHRGGPEGLLNAVRSLAVSARDSGHAVAFGEIGLDYDRLFLSPKDIQLKFFERQLDLAEELQMPLFLHSRACHEDFKHVLTPRLHRFPRRGLVHSFTGSLEEMQELVDMGFDIGINGCSLKMQENLDVVKEVPLDKLQLETDGPWCDIRASHASAKHLVGDGAPVAPKSVKKEKWQRGMLVKGRNEPCMIAQVAWVVARVKGVSVEEVCEAAWRNSVRMFGLGEKEN